MISANTKPNEAASEHIGVAPHKLRNLLLAGGLVVMGAVLALFYLRTASEDTVAAKELESFRQAMYNRCGGEQFAGRPEPKLEELYADSSRMRTVVVRQFQALQQPDANCETVAKALRSADYPIR